MLGRDRRYRVCVSLKGKRITRVVENLTLAREAEAAIKADMMRDVLDINQKPKPNPTLAEVWEKYLPWAKEHKKSWADDLRYYRKHIEPRFGRKRLDAISPMDIERMKKELREGLNRRGKPFAPATIKHQIVILRRLYNLARKWQMYEGKSPIDNVAMPKIDNMKTEFLTEEQANKLFKTLETWPCRTTVAFIKFALFTGFRRGELFKLKWEDVDFDNNLITLKSPKGGQTQTKNVSDEALDVLQGLERTSDYVFPGRNGEQRKDFRGPWLRIRKAANLPEDFRFHGLRHHFASTLVSNGEDLFTVQQLLGHKDNKTTQRYAHLAPSVVKNAALKSGKLLTPKQEQEADNLVELKD